MQCKTAFVTGAGSGIGLALAETFARRGARVAAFDLRFSDEARARLRQACPEAQFFEVDVRHAAGVAASVSQAVAQLGAPDVALNAAGVQVARSFLDLTSESYDAVIDINLKGSRNFAAAVLPHMRSGAHLALVASLAGIVGNYGYAAYCSSKFGVVGLASVLRIESKPQGIVVSVICPPEVPTPMVDEERRTAPAVTMQTKQFAGTVSLPDLCRQVMHGLERDRFMIIPGSWRAGFTARMARFSPRLMARITDAMVTKALRSP